VVNKAFILNFIDKYKDLFYVIWFTHYNTFITAGLWTSIFLPALISLILINHLYFKNEDSTGKKEMVKKLGLTFLRSFFGLNLQSKDKQKSYIVYIIVFAACAGNLIQMSLKLTDSLMIGSTLPFYKGLFIFLDFLIFNYRMG